MITESELYWITRLDDIRWCFGGGVITCCIIAIFLSVAFFVYIMEEDQIPRMISRALLIVGLVGFVCILGVALIPSTKEMAMIKVIPMIANSKFVAEELPADARQIYELGKKALVEKMTGEKK